MNVSVVNLGPCKKQVKVELEAEAVGRTFTDVVREFARQAQLPGFRKGKAPLDKVKQLYADRITEESRKRLLQKHGRQALEENKLRPIVNPDIEIVDFGEDRPMKFLVTVETEPEFELPEYRGLPVKQAKVEVTDDDVNRAIERLRDERADYPAVNRSVQDGDYVVVNYAGTIDGQPVSDFAPTARGLTEQTKYWLHVHAEAARDHFIPGFTGQLIGASATEERIVAINFPDVFGPQPALQGRAAQYRVQIVEVKEKRLPPLDDAFAKSWEAENLEKLRAGVREDLLANQRGENHNLARLQVVKALLERVKCELPETPVVLGMRRLRNQIVREQQSQGASATDIEQRRPEIERFARDEAERELTLGIIINRIAEKEKITVSQEEIVRFAMAEARQAGEDPKKHMQALRDNDGFGAIHSRILQHKTVEFVAKAATIEEVVRPPDKPATDTCS